MNSKRVLAVLAGLFLVCGTLALMGNNAWEGPPITGLTFIVLGTACVAFLAYLKR